MQITSTHSGFREFPRLGSHCGSAQPSNSGDMAMFFVAFRSREAGDALMGAWACLLDRFRGVHELGRGESLGPARVDQAGGLHTRGLSVENGQLRLPGGQTIPFGNTGVIVRLPDGTKVAVGRQGDQAVRWVVAGEGEDIPTSPPGATNVFELDGCGGLRLAGVQ